MLLSHCLPNRLACRYSALWSLCAICGFALAPILLERPAHADQTAGKDKPKEDDYYQLYRELADTIDQVERNYVKPISRRELMEAAINGVLSKLDQHSNYIAPTDLDRFKTSVENQFGGIGIQVSQDKGQLKVIAPVVGSPAYRAGVLAGDRIVEIEGQKTDGMEIDEAVRRMKGPEGSTVALTVVHAIGNKRETLKIQREVVHLETVMSDLRNDDDSWNFLLDAEQGIGYIRVTGFGRETADELEKALKQLKAAKFRGLVLDLRFNPGGLLTSAVEVSDLFLSKGRIVSTEGRNSPAKSWDAREPGTYEGFPLVVLVNRYSASASEIVSACLQDHGRAVVMGERTWGKGSVQNVIELEGGRSALKLTTAGYVRPSGKKIDRLEGDKETDEWGVSPNEGYQMKLSEADMFNLIMSRRARDIAAIHGKPTTEPGDKLADEQKPEKIIASDKQLAKAVEYLTSKLSKGE